MENGATFGMLELILYPAFCVRDGIITRVNRAAQGRLIPEGGSVSDLIRIGKQEYEEFAGGCLYLTLNLEGRNCGATVSRVDGQDVFVLEQDADQAELQAMALAARELREPLASVMTIADQLFPMVGTENDPTIQKQIAQINRGLFQMLRVIGNMSDAARYTGSVTTQQEVLDICALLEEIFIRAKNLVSHGGITLRYMGLKESIYCSVDAEKLERAVLNIVSNAIKFTPAGGSIDAKLTRRGRKLYLQIQDSGSGIASSLLGSLFSRYKREPGLEDSRFGIGLGMVLIRSAAAVHGGTVLVDQPEGQGTRITMTLEIKQNNGTRLSSHILRVDYAGERDHGLIELSDTLPAELYSKENIN